jgi:hypothetical protein
MKITKKTPAAGPSQWHIDCYLSVHSHVSLLIERLFRLKLDQTLHHVHNNHPIQFRLNPIDGWVPVLHVAASPMVNFFFILLGTFLTYALLRVNPVVGGPPTR